MCTVPTPEIRGHYSMAHHLSRDPQTLHIMTSTTGNHLQSQADSALEPGTAQYEKSFPDVKDGERSDGNFEDAAFAAMDAYEAELTSLVDAKGRARRLAECKLADIRKLRIAIGKNGQPSKKQIERLNALKKEYFGACHTIKMLAGRVDMAKKRAVAGLVEEARMLHCSWGDNVELPLFGNPKTAESLLSCAPANEKAIASPDDKEDQPIRTQAVATCQPQTAPSAALIQGDIREQNSKATDEDHCLPPFESEYHISRSNGSLASFKTMYGPSPDGGFNVIESTIEPPAIPIDPCTAAIDNLKQCEDECWNLKANLEEHLRTYTTQFDEICKLDASIDPKLVKDVFGQEYNKRTRHITLLMTHAQNRLRSARVDAKHAGVVNANSPDQTSDFFSTVEDGPKAEIAKFLIDSCDHERILDWQKAPVKAKRMQLSEYEFATSGAEVETWDSLSTRGSPSKRRMINGNHHCVTSTAEPAIDENGRPHLRKEPNRFMRRRARSETACERKPHFSQLLPGNGTDYQLTFAYPVTDDSVWLKPENWDEIVIVEG